MAMSATTMVACTLPKGVSRSPLLNEIKHAGFMSLDLCTCGNFSVNTMITGKHGKKKLKDMVVSCYFQRSV